MTPLNGSRLRDQLAADTLTAGGALVADPADEGSVGRTLFDLPGSTDLTVTVVVPKERVKDVPSQALVRIRSRADGRTYLGVVAAGPFAEPDGLKGDSPILTAVATHGGDYLPPYHGRVHVTLLGEELDADTLVPPRLRPLPNSPVFVLSDAESGRVLKCEGDIRLGLAAGHEGVEVRIPSEKKAVLPRHTAILGTTGGGKSTTVAGFVKQAADAGVAVVLLDVEGEYVHLHEPTDHPGMMKALQARDIPPAGLKPGSMSVYHLVGRDTANPDHPDRKAFSLQFARLSPYAVGEILDLSDAQLERYWKAYEITKEVMRELHVFPAKGDGEQERMALELDEFDRGYPRMTLSLLMDVVSACVARAEPKGDKKSKKGDDEEAPQLAFTPYSAALKTPEGLAALTRRVHAANPPGNVISWRALVGRLARLNRLKVFHGDRDGGVPPMNYKHLLQPGRVSVVDLSDTGHSELNNLVIADILRGLQEAQEDAYEKYEQAVKRGESPAQPRVLVVIEEAHEFLSDERIDKMPILFQQVARIAKRGRKRWLGLCFVTQLPGHLPKQVLGLCNSFVLHKLTDPSVVSVLKRTVPGVEDALWDRLPALAAGQAIASFPHLTRPLLVSVDPAPGKLRMVD